MRSASGLWRLFRRPASRTGHPQGADPLRGSGRQAPRRRAAVVRLAEAVVLGLTIAGALYAFGSIHSPDYASSMFGKRGNSANLLKAQLGTAMLGLAAYQVVLALWIYGRLPRAGFVPHGIRRAHRVGGGVLFLLSLPIAYHCITAYGVQLTTGRVELHAIAGCIFFGAFAAKVVIVRRRRLLQRALPLAGGTLVVLVAILWYTGALWQFRHIHPLGP